MSALVRHLSRYADYHRDGHNVATHMVGIPLIVLGVATLLSRPALGTVGDVAITPAMPVAALAALFYLRLDAVFGAVMAALLALAVWAGGTIAGMSTSWWLTTGLGAFAIGWVFQFVGHYFEGRKPAFVDDLSGLAIGPLFVVAEIGFLLGLRLHVKEAMFDDAVAGRARLTHRERLIPGAPSASPYRDKHFVRNVTGRSRSALASIQVATKRLDRG